MSRENLGARWVDEVTVHVDSLSGTNNESISEWTNASAIDDPKNALWQGGDNASFRGHVNLDATEGEEVVILETGNGGTTAGANPGSGTDVGNHTIRLEGRR